MGKKWAGKGENKVEIIEGNLGPIINKEEGGIHNATYNRVLNNGPGEDTMIISNILYLNYFSLLWAFVTVPCRRGWP